MMRTLAILILLTAVPTNTNDIERRFFPGFQTLPPTPPRNMDPVIYTVLERNALRSKS